MRLIDADALKDGYMNMGYDPNEHPEESYMEGWCKGFNSAVDHCIGHVIYAPTIEPEQRWIPCSERLPDSHGWYICSIKDGRVHSLYYANRLGWIDNVRKHMFELYDIRSKLTGTEVTPDQEAVDWNDWVTAWMPLPEPYKEK